MNRIATLCEHGTFEPHGDGEFIPGSIHLGRPAKWTGTCPGGQLAPLDARIVEGRNAEGVYPPALVERVKAALRTAWAGPLTELYLPAGVEIALEAGAVAVLDALDQFPTPEEVEDECEHCDDCGRPYCDVYTLPDVVWARIHERAPAGLLCPMCALKRLVAHV